MAARGDQQPIQEPDAPAALRSELGEPSLEHELPLAPLRMALSIAASTR